MMFIFVTNQGGSRIAVNADLLATIEQSGVSGSLLTLSGGIEVEVTQTPEEVQFLIEQLGG